MLILKQKTSVLERAVFKKNTKFQKRKERVQRASNNPEK